MEKPASRSQSPTRSPRRTSGGGEGGAPPPRADLYCFKFLKGKCNGDCKFAHIPQESVDELKKAQAKAKAAGKAKAQPKAKAVAKSGVAVADANAE